MGIFDWAKNQFLNVIQYEDSSANEIVHKVPLQHNEEHMKNSKVVVREGQVCAVLIAGKLTDVFEPGTYVLKDLENRPILTYIKSWKYLFETPFTADVFFINTKQFMNNKWGTATPIMMRDKDFGAIRLRGYGTYAFSIQDVETALKEMFGTMHIYTVEHIEGYIRKIVVSKISDVIAESKVAALDLATQYDELSSLAQAKIGAEMSKLGLELNSFYIENLSLPEEVAKTIDERSQVGIMKGSMQDYAAMQSIKAMREAANNDSSGLAGAGIGLGAGVGIGKMFSESMSGISNLDKKSEPEVKKIECPHCGAKNKEKAKFCSECGKSVQVEKITCSKCDAKVRKNAKFCPECGEKLGEKVCVKCEAKLKPRAKFCPECGEKQ